MKENRKKQFELLKKYFESIIKDNHYSRLGKVFTTSKKKYFYDTGTGKIFECKNNVYLILKHLAETNSFDALLELKMEEHELIEALIELKEAVNDENLLQAPPVKAFSGPNVENLVPYINEGLEQITLELSERCNLRCGYCIYGQQNDLFRDFGTRDMSFETARKAIDYAAAHSGKELAVTFYGGEPLLNLDVMKKTIDYCKETIKDKKVTYAITTNLVLMTKEIAEYIASIDDFVVTCSLDGPKEIQNEYRKFPDGTGSFDVVMQGLKNIADALGDKISSRLTFSMVVNPPYTDEKFDLIQEFFEEIDWLPKDVVKNVTYVQDRRQEKIDEKTFLKSFEGDVDPMGAWTNKKISNYAELEQGELFTSKNVENQFLRIHLRRLHDEPMDCYTFNGCCVPGSRRIYVTVDGKFKICERIGLSPYIGNVDQGIDMESVRKYYVQDYMKKAVKDCNECWAVHLCSICYAECYDEKGVNFDGRYALCYGLRYDMEQALSSYHEILESDPKSLEYLNTIDVK